MTAEPYRDAIHIAAEPEVVFDYFTNAGALAPHPDQAGAGQDVQVLRHGLLADVEVRADLARRPRLVADQPEHRLPAGLGERPQHRLAAHAVQCDRPGRHVQALTCNKCRLV